MLLRGFSTTAAIRTCLITVTIYNLAQVPLQTFVITADHPIQLEIGEQRTRTAALENTLDQLLLLLAVPAHRTRSSEKRALTRRLDRADESVAVGFTQTPRPPS